MVKNFHFYVFRFGAFAKGRKTHTYRCMCAGALMFIRPSQTKCLLDAFNTIVILPFTHSRFGIRAFLITFPFFFFPSFFLKNMFVYLPAFNCFFFQDFSLSSDPILPIFPTYSSYLFSASFIYSHSSTHY